MASLKKLIAALAVPCTLAAVVAPANAAFPEKPLKIVVPYSTGGSSDSIARIVADPLSKELGQAVVVENRPGAGSMIGTSYVAEQDADGYTLLLADVPFTIVPALYSDRIKYDAKKDFVPVSLVGQSAMYLFVNNEFPAANVQELVEQARKRPGAVTIGSGGNGSFTHLLAELLMQASDTKFVHVPYKGAAASLNDLAGGQIDASFASMPSAAAIYAAGKVRPIGASTPERHRDTPDVPTFKESGYDSLSIQSWWGLTVPAGTPEDVRARLSEAVVKVMQDPKLHERLSRLGVDVPSDTTPEAMSRFLQEDFKRWEELVSSTGIELN